VLSAAGIFLLPNCWPASDGMSSFRGRFWSKAISCCELADYARAAITFGESLAAGIPRLELVRYCPPGNGDASWRERLGSLAF
jgi:hypothetical protein